MGCDIHCKCTFYDKSTQMYVDSSKINQLLDDSVKFEELVGTRYYDAFGMFGNTVRSIFPIMKYLEDGTCEWFDELYPDDANDSDYYGFTHCTIGKLKLGLYSYKKKINSKKFKREKSSPYEFFPIDEERIENLSNYIEDLVDILETYKRTFESSMFKIISDTFGYDLDFKRTTFTFWFDN